MALYAVSDLHLLDQHDPLLGSLNRLVQTRVSTGDVLVLAGDIFELFVGDKKIFRKRFSSFFEALREAGSRGAQIHFIEGNHDFQLRKTFEKIPNCTWHDQEVKLQIAGKSFYIAHGDQVDLEDRGYQFLRAFLRSAPMKTFVRVAPGRLLDAIGRKASHWSQSARRDGSARGEISSSHFEKYLPRPETLERLRAMYRDFSRARFEEGHDYVVLGHCHDADAWDTTVQGRACQYRNLGFPRVHGGILVWTDAASGWKRIPWEG